MDTNEMLAKATHKFGRNELVQIITDLCAASDKEFTKLKDVISKGKTRKTPVNEQTTKHFLYSVIPQSIIKYDIKHAMELAEIDNEEMFNIKVVRSESCEPASIKKFKTNIFKGVNGKDGIFFEDKRKMSYAILSSTELFPNTEVFKEKSLCKHLFTINSTGENYIDVVTNLYEAFLRDSIPFNIVIRLPKDMNYGFPDPIRLYVTDNSLQATIDELVSTLTPMRDKIETPDWRTCASIDGLYGYIQVDSDNKTPIDNLFNTITKTIDQELTDYDINHGRTPIREYNWTNRTNKLIKMQVLDPDNYERILDNIMEYISVMNINTEDIFKVETTKQQEVINTKEEQTKVEEPIQNDLDKDIHDMDLLLGALDNSINSLEVEEEQTYVENIEDELDKTDVIDVPSIENQLMSNEEVVENVEEVQSPLDELIINQGEPVEETLVPQNVEEQEVVEDVKEEIPESTITNEPTYNEIQDDLDLFDNSVSNNMVVEEQQPMFNEEQAFINNISEETQEENEKIVRDRLDETQAYVPVTEEMILGFNEQKKSTPPVLPEDVSEVDPQKEIDEDEFVSLDTGSYQAIPVEVTNFDGEEVKSIVEAPQAGQTISAKQAEVALDEYAEVISSSEALTDIVNSKGENVSLIDYLHNENISTKVPFDATVVLNDGSVISGKEFIKNYVIPIVKQNRADQIFTVDQIINNYSTELSNPNSTKKKGFFAKLFGKKK